MGPIDLKRDDDAREASDSLFDMVHEAREEVERLNAVLDRAGHAWLGLEPPVVWEGSLADAMQAAVGEIERMRRKYEPVPREGERWWSCLIGPFTESLPGDADSPMRNAAQDAFEKLSGDYAEECLSGWNASPTAKEREIIDDAE